MAPPDPQVYFNHAAHNERLLDVFETEVLPRFPEFFDWAIVVIFYAALHYVQGALLRDHGVVARAHRSYSDEVGAKAPGLNELVRQHLERDVRDAYLELFDRAQEARYRSFFKKGMRLDWRSQLALYRVQLETIKAACL
jgi:hypothetical protein